MIVRGWLNCNQIVLLEAGNNVLVDSGYCTHREQTLDRLAGPEGLDGKPLERLINTHCHADHMGGNAAVASAYGCRITVPEGEVKHIVPWTPQSVWMEKFDQRADPFRFEDTIGPGDTFDAGERAWQAHPAPGHDMDALMYFEPRDRILITGDALWESGMGIVWPDEGAHSYIEAARDALAAIERLGPAIVIPGHGEPFADAARAIATARAKLDAFARDPSKNARHLVKVLFVFALLERGSMPLGEVARYMERFGCYREISERFLGLEIPALAASTLEDLGRAGAVRIDGGVVHPTMPA